jgi:2-oxoglutarate dehydrogenase E2 component (dihydrolipoamide succinyltransferase)
MSIEIKVPTVGESISEVTLVKWHKKDGEWANRDEVIAELESEKATFELNAEQAGAIKIIAHEGDTLNIGDVVCSIDTKAAKPEGAAVKTTDDRPQTTEEKPQTTGDRPQTEVKATPA